jgi:hypothetical protein
MADANPIRRVDNKIGVSQCRALWARVSYKVKILVYSLFYIKEVRRMKQRITCEQLKELTEEQKQRLREWWKPQEHDIYVVWGDYVTAVGKGCESDINKENCTPLLSIGQMIEIVANHFKEVKMPVVQIGDEVKTDFYGAMMPLCDALWQAVKEVL